MTFVFIAIGSLGIWLIGWQLTLPAHTAIGDGPKEMHVENIDFEGVRGWFLGGDEGKVCILLLHGIRSNRLEMMPRARFLNGLGYPAMAIDLQGHGETPGTTITFGYKESGSARQAVKFLREEAGCKKMVVIGSSLGGAASLLGVEPLEVNGFVLEGVYSDIRTAVESRLRIRMGYFGELLSPLLYWQIPLRLNIELKDLRPMDAIKKVTVPVLIMNGSEDDRATQSDAQILYENAVGLKRLVWFEGAGHIDLYEFDREEYKKEILVFLENIK